MNLKVALLLMLVFASGITVTSVAFNTSTPVSLNTLGSIVAQSNPILVPLGDPIVDPGPPHAPSQP